MAETKPLRMAKPSVLFWMIGVGVVVALATRSAVPWSWGFPGVFFVVGLLARTVVPRLNPNVQPFVLPVLIVVPLSIADRVFYGIHAHELTAIPFVASMLMVSLASGVLVAHGLLTRQTKPLQSPPPA